jgi:hypothetical protein
MKNNILTFILFVVLSTNAFGQLFVNPSNKWYASDCCSSFGSGGTDCSTYKYWFDDPIIIDTLSYLTLKTNNQQQLFEAGKYYREENGIVYMKVNQSQEEIVIYSNSE